MRCPDHQTISAFVDGELEAAEAAQVERHIPACARCRQFVEEMELLDARGRAALDAINVGEAPAAANIGRRPSLPKWAHPLAVAAAATALAALSILTWLATTNASRHQRPAPHHFANATLPAASAQSDESQDAAFEQWAAPFRKLQIPLVSMEVVENYNPAPILPVLPEKIERNN